MIYLSTYSATRTFLLNPKSLTLTRRYEEDEYAFVAGDIDITAIDVAELYEAVIGGEEVSLVITDVPAIGTPVCKFRGTIQSEGADYDPEKDEYSFTAVHAAKKIFEAAKNQPLKDVWLYAFDYMLPNFLYGGQICKVNLTPYDFEFASNDTGSDIFITASGLSTYNFLFENPGYTLRDYWIDFAKHYRALLSVPNDLDPVSGLCQLNVLSRQTLSGTYHSGHDDAIASYKETSRNPQYSAVMFPCRLQIDATIYNCYAVYSQSGALLTPIGSLPRNPLSIRAYPVGAECTVPDNCLDLRVPAGIYGNTYPAYFPFQSIPLFRFTSRYAPIGESVLEYCTRHFYRLISHYQEIEVLYSELLNINPCETIVIRGKNVPIVEIEDDLVDETTKITGRRYE